MGRINAQTISDVRKLQRGLKPVVKQLLRLLQPTWAIGTPIRMKSGSVDNQFIKQSFERQSGQTIGSTEFTTDTGCKGRNVLRLQDHRLVEEGRYPLNFTCRVWQD